MKQVKDIDSPSGLDLNPEPPTPIRLSKRAGILALFIVFVVLALIGYGMFTRGNRSFQVGFHPDETKGLTAATDAGKVVAASVPNRPVPGSLTNANPPDLQPPDPGPQVAQPMPQPLHTAPAPTLPQYREPTAEEKRLAQQYEREQEALNASTVPRETSGAMSRGASQEGSNPESDPAPLANLLRGLQAPGSSGPPTRTAPANSSASQSEDYESQNMQDQKEVFLAKVRAAARDSYLLSTRVRPLGRYEIKAGWDIPAVLEQALNSDLPGEIKALVRENVYDTASGQYLLIPQGARLVGIYSARVSYGQNAIQVVWNRIIFPDGSSINLEGMSGQDAKGQTGARYEVDNHYKRLLGFGLLTSVFSAAFQLSQSRRGGVLNYPSTAEVAGSSVGQEISQLGADVTRRNLNVQPTIKVPIGNRFNVRVNRDILFSEPYRPFPL